MGAEIVVTDNSNSYLGGLGTVVEKVVVDDNSKLEVGSDLARRILEWLDFQQLETFNNLTHFRIRTTNEVACNGGICVNTPAWSNIYLRNPGDRIYVAAYVNGSLYQVEVRHF